LIKKEIGVRTRAVQILDRIEDKLLRPVSQQVIEQGRFPNLARTQHGDNREQPSQFRQPLLQHTPMVLHNATA